MGTDLSGHRRRADKRLPDIAGLIDPAQFDLIARPSTGFVVIRGTAGSGKTTVALHRIAYLAYQDPVFDSPATLFMVFSPALKDYVRHVLPALGVHRAQVADFRSWAAAQRARHFPRLPKTHRDNTPANVIKVKLHPGTMLALERQVDTVPGRSNGDQAFDDWMSTMTRAQALYDCIEEVNPGAFTRDEIQAVADWCRDAIEEIIARMEGDKDIEPALDVEDDALLLRAWQLRAGPLRRKKNANLRFRHIAIDEVQDFSPLEVRVLMDCLDRNQSITLAGDTQQHVMKDAGFTSWADFFRHLGLPGTAVNTLKIAYRSSRPIVNFAMGVLGELREDTTMPEVPRDGPAVELFRFTDHGAAVAFLADALKDLQDAEPLASIALLTSNASVSGIYHAGLSQGEVPRLRRVVNHAFTFAPGVEITEVDQVKGLEFDYIVLIEVSAANYPDTDASRRVLHVGATRAVHQLWLTAVGEPSPMIHEALDN
jgi:DNA helicase-2/ATP-dependent DNA helicase PcrA